MAALSGFAGTVAGQLSFVPFQQHRWGSLAMYFVLLIAVLATAWALMWNSLVRRRNAIANAFAGIDTMLQMRYDLIPNLVSVVKGYAQHESETLRAISELRAQAMQANLGTNQRV